MAGLAVAARRPFWVRRLSPALRVSRGCPGISMSLRGGLRGLSWTVVAGAVALPLRFCFGQGILLEFG